MKRVFDPQRLDVEPFAREGGHLEGRWPLAELQRLSAAPAGSPPDVVWQVEGASRARSVGDDELWLQLRAEATVSLPCQRCLAPVQLPLAIDRRFRFVRDEAAAEALDAELDDDVLALSRALDLRTLVEDELLLALPLVPRHERCPDGALAWAPDEAPAVAAADSPFAALAALKKGDGGS